MKLKDMRFKRPGPDPERQALLERLAEATSELDDLATAKTAIALDAANGNAAALKEFGRLEDEIGRVSQRVDVYTRAVEAFDRALAEAALERQVERRTKAEARHKAMLDLAYVEQRGYITDNIKRLEASGDTRQAEIWRHELGRLRETLESTMPFAGGQANDF